MPRQFPLRRVCDHPGRLVHDGKMLVFVDDFDRQVLGLRESLRGSSGRWIEMMSPDRTRYEAFTVAAVDPHAFGVDHLLEHLAGIVGEPAGQVRVDPLPIDARLDFKFQGSLRKRRGPHGGRSACDALWPRAHAARTRRSRGQVPPGGSSHEWLRVCRLERVSSTRRRRLEFARCPGRA